MKALIHLVPRFGADETFDARVRDLAESLRGSRQDDSLAVNAMFRLPDDPFGRRAAFGASLELIDPDASAASLQLRLAGLETTLQDVAHLDLSMLSIGQDIVFLAPTRAPLRMQYLMRRKAGLTREQYLSHYRDVHSTFGLRTPGIAGYVQFHVDAKASRAAATVLGCGGFGIDSVSQLYLDDVQVFLDAVSAASVGREAIADEKTFVDRRNSVDFVSRVEWQS